MSTQTENAEGKRGWAGLGWALLVSLPLQSAAVLEQLLPIIAQPSPAQPSVSELEPGLTPPRLHHPPSLGGDSP